MAAARRAIRTTRCSAQRKRRSNSLSQQPRLSCPGSTGASSIPETSEIYREAAAYWIARSSRAMTVERKEKAGSAPGLLVLMDGRVKPGRDGLRPSLRLGPLRRGRRPRLDQRVVVDGLAFRLLVGELALR